MTELIRGKTDGTNWTETETVAEAKTESESETETVESEESVRLVVRRLESPAPPDVSHVSFTDRSPKVSTPDQGVRDLKGTTPQILTSR